MNKKGYYLRNKELSDPNWIIRKQQDWFAFKSAFDRLSWGAAYLPAGCFDDYYSIGKVIGRMDDIIKNWKVEEPEYIKLRKTPTARRLQ